MTENQSNIAILLLAAGASARLGQPKQLLEIGEHTLLEKMAGEALASGCWPVVVVLGAISEKIKPAIAHLPVQIALNENWENGMGSSISSGIRFLQNKYPEVETTIVMLCDQPYVKTEILLHLVETWRETGKGIVASSYSGSFGPPVLFDRRFFPELAVLKGEPGAKSVMLAHQDELALAPFPAGEIDLDTQADYEKLPFCS